METDASGPMCRRRIWGCLEKMRRKKLRGEKLCASGPLAWEGGEGYRDMSRQHGRELKRKRKKQCMAKEYITYLHVNAMQNNKVEWKWGLSVLHYTYASVDQDSRRCGVGYGDE